MVMMHNETTFSHAQVLYSLRHFYDMPAHRGRLKRSFQTKKCQTILVYTFGSQELREDYAEGRKSWKSCAALHFIICILTSTHFVNPTIVFLSFFQGSTTQPSTRIAVDPPWVAAAGADPPPPSCRLWALIRNLFFHSCKRLHSSLLYAQHSSFCP